MKKLLFLVIATVSACIIYTKPDYQVVEGFNVTDQVETVWLEPGDAIMYKKSVIMEATEGTEVKLSVPGYYKVLTKNLK